MALTSDDYIDITNAIIDLISLKEQQESARLIDEKLKHLQKKVFESNAKKQKYYAIVIARLKYAEERLLIKSTNVDPLLKETWELLASNVNKELIRIKKLKRTLSR